MDILISSNLERLLFFASDFNDKLVAELMGKLNTEGSYKVAEDVFAKIEAEFDAGCCDDSHAADTINKLWKDENYLCDTHTAVAVRVYEDYRARTGDETPTVIASTASPFKFCRSVIEALGGHARERRRYPAGGALSADGCTGTRSACRSGRARRRALTAW